MDDEREERWQLIEEIGRRNTFIDSEEAQWDIADTITEMRDETRLAGKNYAGSWHRTANYLHESSG